MIKSINPLKYFTILIAALLLNLFTANKSNASHLAAFDMWVTYIGAGIDGCTGTTEYKYEVALDIYVSCEGGAGPVTGFISIPYTSATLGAGGNATTTITTADLDTVSELCDSLKPFNSCAYPANQQFKAYVRSKIRIPVTLPGAAPDWVFSWNSCCRNGGITNLLNPSSRSIYVECGLNNVIKYNNSTPKFTVPPLPYICANQPANYLNGPIDPNGDSLRVTNINAFEGAAAPIPYDVGYSLADPIASVGSNPYRVDTFTGTARFTPSNAGYFVLAFQCDEYDRATGIRTGYIRRDAQVSVFNCAAPPPVVDTNFVSGNLTNSTFVKKDVIVCPGSSMSYTAKANSNVSTSKLYMEANVGDFAGSTFTTTGTGTTSSSGVFTWTPTTADLGEHTLIITSKDSTCSGGGYSIVLKNYVVLLIRVVPGLDAGKDLAVCELNPSPRQLFVRGAEYLTQIKWTDINGGSAQFLSNDTIVNPVSSTNQTIGYIVSSPQLTGACKSKDTVFVYKDTSNTIDIFPQG
ncbi:MAG TPA: hypothetical protein VK167_09850, partial [Flavipsychrobacter sp.]|nr:hypothetical protein [Flavipsychrobacter sp.]